MSVPQSWQGELGSVWTPNEPLDDPFLLARRVSLFEVAVVASFQLEAGRDDPLTRLQSIALLTHCCPVVSPETGLTSLNDDFTGENHQLLG